MVPPAQVDVVQHPTIGVISDNYIDRFPHHAYAPTESIVTEAPVGVAVAAARTSIDYAGLFSAGRQESENNNWQELVSKLGLRKLKCEHIPPGRRWSAP
ncbi:hypothetical protein HPB48_018836 [Haemaphysalis longicornis]|uniref:Uncharacterized protein n=1 Tax=Haemaphysalis longicornis TaxID=44386 RepID=A0A9J6FZI0_HAELO|nr:hypothetical protein HPB48_018836 [Haemaphysalis longicornis]